MTKCTSCGVEHGMVIGDMKTGETTPIDWCKECFFTKGYTIKTPDPVRLCEDPIWGTIPDAGDVMRKAHDEVLRNMLLYSACTPLVED